MTTMLTTTARLIRQGATTTATYSRQTNRCISSTLPARGLPPVDYDHFTSGWTKDSSEYTTEGKFHIKTFNKISPLVSKIDLLGGIAVQQCLLSRERHVCFDMYTCLVLPSCVCNNATVHIAPNEPPIQANNHHISCQINNL